MFALIKHKNANNTKGARSCMNKRTLSLLTLCIYLFTMCIGGLTFSSVAQANPIKSQAQNELLTNGMLLLADFSNLSSAEQDMSLVSVETADGATASVSTDYTMSPGSASALKLGNLKNGSSFYVKSKYTTDLFPSSYTIRIVFGIKNNDDGDTDKIPLARWIEVGTGGSYTGSSSDKTFTAQDTNSAHNVKDDVMINNSQTTLTGLSAHGNELRFGFRIRAALTNGSGTAANTDLYIEKIYLEANSWGQILSAPTATTNDISDVIYETLDGSNAYSFTFAEKLYAGEEAVDIFEVTSDGEEATSHPYNVTINNEKLKIQFEGPVTPYATYKIKLDKEKIISASGKKLAGDVIREFYVSNTADIFNVAFHAPANNAVVTTFPGEIVLNFTNDVATGQELSDLISIYKGGTKLYNTFVPVLLGNAITLSFESSLGDGEYKIEVDKSILNSNSESLTEDYEFIFTVASIVPVIQTLDVFEAGDDADMADASGISAESDASLVNMYSVTARRNYGAGAQVTSKFYDEQRSFDATDMDYLNLWLYSPESSQDLINVSCYTSFADNKYRLCQVPQNWLGWKLVSLSLSGFNNSSQGKSFERVYVNIGGWSTQRAEAGYILIDRIWFSKEQPKDFSLKSISMADGYQNAKIIGEQLVYTFSEELDSSVIPQALITGGSSVPVSNVEVLEDKAIVTLGELVPGAEYTIQLKNAVAKDGATYSATPVRRFTAAREGAYLNDITFSASASEGVTNTVTFDFDVFGASSHSIQTVIYAMDDDNGYTGEIIENHDISVSSDSAVLSFTCPTGTTKLKAFALDCNGDVISHKVITLSESTKSAESFVSLGTNEHADIKSAQLNVNIVTVDAFVGGLYGGGLLNIKSSDGIYTACKDIIIPGYEGLIYYSLRMPDTVESGLYNVTLKSGSHSDGASVYYLDRADRDLLLSLANGTNAPTLTSFISTHCKAFGFDTISSQYARDIATLIIAEDSFGGYTEVRDYIKSIKAQVDLANGKAWSDITNVIKNNSAFFGGSTDTEYVYFSGLSESAKNKVSVNMCSYVPASSITALNSAFEKAITDYKNSLDDGGSSYTPSTGGSVLGGFTPSNPSAQVPAVSKPVFTDISGVAWASDYIVYLHEKGVVSKPADGKFRPNDSVTREEFVKMLVTAFYADALPASHTFTDAENGAWYTEYLLKAYSAGLTTGYPDGSFGVGMLITREEMATLCSRAVNALGANPNGEYSLSFTDSAGVSAYAAEHVAVLSQMKIINGYTDGTFVPQGNATRAEAAKIIAMLIQRN